MRYGVVFSVVTFLTGVAQAEDLSRPRLFALDLRAESGLNESQVRMLNEILLAELQRDGRFEIFGEADLKSVVEIGQTKQLVGCDDVACMAEIGGALGADLTLVGSAGALDDLFVLSLKVVNTKKARVAGRWSDTAAGKSSVLVEKIKAGVKDVLSQLEVKAPPMPEPSAAVADPRSPSPTRTPEPTPTPKPERPIAPTPPDAPATATAAPPAHVTAPPPAAEDDDTAAYETWWFWTIIGAGVLVAGGATVGIVVGSQQTGEGPPDPVGPSINVTATLPQP